MTRTRTVFCCAECGASSPKWVGQCPDCATWGSLVEEVRAPTSRPMARAVAAPVRLAEVDLREFVAIPTLVAELDRVLGGGLVPGSVSLVGGEPGVGKSTLLLQAAAGFAHGGRPVLYVSAEEAVQQVRMRAERLGTTGDDLWLVSETDLDAVCRAADELDPALVVVDSIQTMHDAALTSAPGSVGQVRQCAQRLVEVAKRTACSVVLVGHVTKDGGLAGPRVLEHVVDTVLAFEGDRQHALRMLRALKHRFGSTDELGLFEMTATGMVGVPDPSALFLADRRADTAGSVVVPTVDGTRPVLVEVQALVDRSQLPTPRRSAQGVDPRRLDTVLAVLDRRGGANVAGHDVYVATAGGARTVEPGADLAIALAVVSAGRDRPLPRDLVVCGEIGLGGEIRQVGQVGRRLAEAERLGFCEALVPPGSPEVAGIRSRTVDDVAAAVGAVGLAR